MIKISIFRIFSITLLLLFTACVTTQSVDVPPSYTLGASAPDQPSEGVIAFSMHANIKDLPCSRDINIIGRCRLYVSVTDRNRRIIKGLEVLDAFSLDATKEGLYGPATYIAGPLQPRDDMVILKLPAGQYVLGGWFMEFGTGTISPRGSNDNYSFNVTPGKANYLGRINLVLDVKDRKNLRFTSSIKNRSRIEIPKLLTTFPQFRGKAETRLFRRF